MITLILTRKVRNENGVFGELSFKYGHMLYRYITVERVQCPKNWEKLTATQRIKYCIPAGTYGVKYEWDENLNLRFNIRGVSSWRNMHFTGSNDKLSNTIKIGTEATEDGYIRNGDEVLQEISDVLDEMMFSDVIPQLPAYGFFEISIRESFDYHEESMYQIANL